MPIKFPQFDEGSMGREEILELTKQAFQQILETLDGKDLANFFQIVVSEMYIRSGDDERWVETWDAAADTVRLMFDENTTPVPEVYADYREARDQLEADRLRVIEARTSKMELNEFHSRATKDLDELFKQHGVLDEGDSPGQYL